jgi:cobalt-zinc-cadmium efflux system outer membrane protein
MALALVPLAGCLGPVRQDTDALVCKRAGLPVDALAPPPSFEPVLTKEALLPPAGKPDLLKRLEIPPGVPGAQTPPIRLPENFRQLPPEEKEKILSRFFPPQFALGPDPVPVPGPDGRALTLADLQHLARANSPLLREAASNIKGAEGAAVQAGLYPNPVVGTSTATMGPSGGPMFGAVISQLIKVGGKLKLAEAAAAIDVANAQLAYRKAETDLMTSVRTSYFAVLVAEQSMRANRALAELTDEVYKVMKLQRAGGLFAPAEVAQVGVLAGQARAAQITSRNSYLLAWKQLASALGLPLMPATALAGGIDLSLPHFEFEPALAHVLVNHTDVLTARYSIEKARYNLRLAQVTPIPDVNLQATVQYDATPPGPNRIITLLSATVPVPLWDRNQGAIRQAQAQLVYATEEPHRVESDLTAKVSDAFRRLEENRTLLELNRTHLLPHSVQAFRGMVLRHFAGVGLDKDAPAVSFTDLIQAEQSVIGVVATYLTTLQAYWQAVSDVAGLLQTDDVYQMAVAVQNCPMPDLAQLLRLPCSHPCAAPGCAPEGAPAAVPPAPAPPAIHPALFGTPQAAPQAATPAAPPASESPATPR